MGGESADRPVPDAAARTPARPIVTVVVGGGIAGLVAAWVRAQAGDHVLVLEASEQVGGTVRGATLDLADGSTVTVDVGAESFATRTPAVADLARDLGLAVVQPDPLGAWAYAAERAHDDPDAPLRPVAVPLPRTATLGIPTSPWSRDVRRALGTWGALRAWWDLGMPRTPVPPPDRPWSLADWVRERLGETVLDRLVAPVAGGVHSADPATLDPRTVAPQLVAAYEKTGSLLRAASQVAAAPGRGKDKPGSPVAGVEGGMHRIVDELVDAIEAAGGAVRTGVRVDALVRNGDGDGWVVRAGDEQVAAARVVAATPRRVATDLLGDLLPPATAHPRHGSDVQLVTLVLDAPALDAAPRGTGVLVAPSADVRAKGLTHATAKWPWLRAALPVHRHVVRLSYGRAGDPGHTRVPDVDEALADASRLLGVTLDRAAVVGHLGTHWPDALAPAVSFDRERAEAAQAAAPGLTVVGGWVAGTGLAAVVGHARAAVTPPAIA
ncbi:protoporphyrinogen/coproporphyrinogen oxidase [Luteimicrobium subarcticum]|uniref:Oxygen-dependent protoporphyrinogen oxidase n=1 Tax=Luteimicrobium subarcticum TaxID=620910 RepID=A0A2M8WRX0_9MICO|nr:FAD-dependent oxidoreductase [Luteimicrobium subarcticum]PJI93683.1 oxygen-dependent protoporphyrinogen oxidase [Luteimicrobium subarcticum]